MTVTKFSMVGAAALAIVFSAGGVGGVAAMLTNSNKPKTLLYDDFDDGDITDGQPAGWSLAGGNIVADVSSGDLVLSDPTNFIGGVLAVSSPRLNLRNVSIQAQVRVQGSAKGIALDARATAGDQTAYTAGIDEQLGELYIGYYSPANQVVGLYADLGTVTKTNLRPSQEDVVLQLDVIEDTLSLYGWRAGEPKPDVPQIQVTTSLFDTGTVGITFDPLAPGSTGVFRYVHVADGPIIP